MAFSVVVCERKLGSLNVFRVAGVFQLCQFRAGFVKDAEKREAMWDRQHELAADKMYSLCSELGGLFLKVVYYEWLFIGIGLVS